MSEPSDFAVAVAQCSSVVGDIEGNLAIVEKYCSEARDLYADLVLFPECHATGYSYLDQATLVKETAQPMEGPIGHQLRALARQFGLVVCCGMFEQDGNSYFNTHLVAFPDGRLERQRKGTWSPLEEGLLTIDPVRQLFVWKGYRFGILVCADIALPDFPEQFQKLDISLLLHPSAGRIMETGRDAENALKAGAKTILREAHALAKRMSAVYAVANPIGFSGEDYYPGNSWVVHPRDGLLVSLPPTGLVEEMRMELGVVTLCKADPRHTQCNSFCKRCELTHGFPRKTTVNATQA